MRPLTYLPQRERGISLLAMAQVSSPTPVLVCLLLALRVPCLRSSHARAPPAGAAHASPAGAGARIAMRMACMTYSYLHA